MGRSGTQEAKSRWWGGGWRRAPSHVRSRVRMRAMRADRRDMCVYVCACVRVYVCPRAKVLNCRNVVSAGSCTCTVGKKKRREKKRKEKEKKKYIYIYMYIYICIFMHKWRKGRARDCAILRHTHRHVLFYANHADIPSTFSLASRESLIYIYIYI